MHPDPDLHTHFARQRRADHAAAPAWNPTLLHTVPGARSWRLPMAWLLPAAASCLLAAGIFWSGHQAAPPGQDLAGALPEFFSPQGDPLFAGLGSALAAPSDILLPLHLTIPLP